MSQNNVVAFPGLYPSFSERPMKVLGAELSKRIAAVNDLLRYLTRHQIHMESQDLLAKKRPVVRISRGCRCLQTAAEAIRTHAGEVTAVINGVDVIWPESGLENSPTKLH